MTEISGPRPATPSPATARSAAQNVAQTLKLLQPLGGLLASGETAKAEVVAVKSIEQSFQVLLKLTLESGRQTTLEATSSRPLALGLSTAVTALSDTRLSVLLQGGAEKPLGQLDLNQLPVGTLLQGKVLSREALPGQTGPQAVFKTVVMLLNSALAGRTLNLETNLALQPGSLLSAEVKGAQALNFIPLGSRLDQLALNQHLGGQQTRQGSLDGLLKTMQSLNSQPGLSEGLRSSIDKLFAALPDSSQLSTAKGLSGALENSGLFLESKLLGGQTQQLPTDLKANLLRLLGQLQPNLTNPAPLLPANAAASTALSQALPAFARNILGNLAQSNSRQQALSFPLHAGAALNGEEEADLEALLKLAAAAISRLQTHQLSSLAQSQIGPDGNLLTTWQLEVPMRHAQEFYPVQIKVQQDQQEQQSQTDEPRETLWKVELAFDIPPLGPIHVQAQLAFGSLSGCLWAQQSDTALLIDSELDNLRERLLAAGLQVRELACKQGTAPQGARTTLEQRWVDETA
ncbi:MAG: flagellar hook-length control protein FliK [Pseudomonadaceae bacterium]|nr:flagellar hook-length control protein FliK [Pseudomonadaceae bacterium]